MAQRSRYPAIPLPEAVAKVERIYEKEGPNAMSSEVAAQHMGYGGLNGASLTALATLKKYGLLEGRASDLAVTREGIVIVSDKKASDQSERLEALKAAFLSDPLFRELDDRFKGKTTEINVVSYLQKKGFAPSAAKSASRSYIESAAFVDKETEGYDWRIPASGDEPAMQARSTSSEAQQKAPATQYPVISGDFRDAPIVIGGVSQWPILRLPKAFTGKNWDDMITMLKAMKDGFITSDTSSLTPDNSAAHGGKSQGTE